MKRDLRSRDEKKAAVQSDGIARITLSFYKYVHIPDPTLLQRELLSVWGNLGCLGRIYVAHEGINAQMNVPKQNWKKFNEFMKSKGEFFGVPYKIAIEEGDAPSFYKLNIKVKEKIVADGLDDNTFDPSDTGAYVTAREMNAYIDDPDAVVVDMRNSYESEIGHFENAVTPDVDTFREELRVLPKQLQIHKNKKIALYCTGGIRCEKASAWLKYNGYKDVKHLKGGIIDYKRQVDNEKLENKFKGKNFVFDERMGERIGDEIISHCHLCSKNKSDEHRHCKSTACHILYLCCDDCLETRRGYCSTYCRVFDALPQSIKKFYTRQYNKFLRPTQFKKHRMKGRIA